MRGAKESKGNPVRIRNSTRCCKSSSQGHWDTNTREGAAPWTSQKTCRFAIDEDAYGTMGSTRQFTAMVTGNGHRFMTRTRL